MTAFSSAYWRCLNLWRSGRKIVIPKCPFGKVSLLPGTPCPSLGLGRDLVWESSAPPVNLLARVLPRGAERPTHEIGGFPVGASRLFRGIPLPRKGTARDYEIILRRILRIPCRNSIMAYQAGRARFATRPGSPWRRSLFVSMVNAGNSRRGRKWREGRRDSRGRCAWLKFIR